MKRHLFILFFSLFITLSFSSNVFAEMSVKDYKDYDPTSYWAEPMEWAVNKGLIKGYPEEGKLKPYNTLTEAQFLTVLFLYLAPEEDLSTTYKKHWAYKQFGLVEKYNLEAPSSYKNPSNAEKGIRRGDVARLIAEAITGKPLTEQQAVQWLYDNNISAGYSDKTGYFPKTYESYHADSTLKRAQFVKFVHSIEMSNLPKEIKKVNRTINNQKSTFTSPEGIKFISETGAWKEDKLKDLYFELLNNKHGKELSYLSEVIISPEDPVGKAGEFHGMYTWGSKGIKLLPERTIILFNGNERTTVEEMAGTLSHEYGHLFTYYWLTESEGKLPDNPNTKWASIRNLDGYPIRWSNSTFPYNHYWQPEEIMADEYVVFFGSKTAKKMLNPQVDIPADGQVYTFTDHSYPSAIENKQVPAAWATKGLYQYWLNISKVKVEAQPSIKNPIITGITYGQKEVGGWPTTILNVKFDNASHTSKRPIQYFVRMTTKDQPYGTWTDGQSATFTNTTIVPYGDYVKDNGYHVWVWTPTGKAGVQVFAYDPETKQLTYSDEQWFDFTDPNNIKKIPSQFKLN